MLLACFVVDRLPPDYMIQPTDLPWLGFCDEHLVGDLTNTSVLEASKKAVELRRGWLHCDPFELLVDAEICDTELKVR